MEKISQKSMILSHLRKFGSITSMEAINLYGATRLSDIIFKLRNSGYDIKSIPMQTTNRFGHNTNYVKYVLKGIEDGTTSN